MGPPPHLQGLSGGGSICGSGRSRSDLETMTPVGRLVHLASLWLDLTMPESPIGTWEQSQTLHGPHAQVSHWEQVLHECRHAQSRVEGKSPLPHRTGLQQAHPPSQASAPGHGGPACPAGCCSSWLALGPPESAGATSQAVPSVTVVEKEGRGPGMQSLARPLWRQSSQTAKLLLQIRSCHPFGTCMVAPS